MQFNSLEYLVFLPLVWIAFAFLPRVAKPFLLLLASYYFYMSWNPIYLLLIIGSTLIDFLAGWRIQTCHDALKRKIYLGISLTLNLGLLVFFKYINFGIENLSDFLMWSNQRTEPLALLDIILPVGISFYTFQTMSYTIDVYQRKTVATKNLVQFALYVCFFPQLVAGPIERYSQLAPQFKQHFPINFDNIQRAVWLILYGLFIKMVIADNIGVVVDEIYSDFNAGKSNNLWLATFAYPLQIYGDFHGYSTIAIGSAKLFNIHLSDNFRGPFWSTSLTDFWRKWHISLTNWFRDYVYYPLGGNKLGLLRMGIAVFIVFILSGIWHGANWTFVAWGFFHALITWLEKVTGYQKFGTTSRFIRTVQGLLTFLIVALLFVYFRSPTIGFAHQWFLSLGNFTCDVTVFDVTVIVVTILFLFLDFTLRNKNFGDWMANLQTRKGAVFVRWSIGIILLFCLLAFGGANQQPFIYFQF